MLEGEDTAVENYKVQQTVADERAVPEVTYGVLADGLDTVSEAWSGARRVFTVNPTHAPPTGITIQGNRPPQDLLLKHPVDILVVDRSKHLLPPGGHEAPTAIWESLARAALFKPKTVVESWVGIASTWENSPTTKACTTRWTELGYSTRFKWVRASHVGGAIRQDRLMVIRSIGAILPKFRWPEQDTDVSERPMSNLLQPPGLVPIRAWKDRPPASVKRAYDPLTEPMPWGRDGSYRPWIRVGDRTRQVLEVEQAKALGLDVKSLAQLAASELQRGIRYTTSVYHWEYVSQALASDRLEPVRVRLPGLSSSVEGTLQFVLNHRKMVEELPDPGRPKPVTWTPPSLKPGGKWHRERVNNLFVAAKQYPGDWLEVINDGLDDLATHRLNYTSKGPRPKQLVILWWEFPPEHWVALREGSLLNIMQDPGTGVTPNGDMDAEQRLVAIDFFDELVDLSIVEESASPEGIRATTPLFVLPKDGQPGQWRVIANMKEGGQNDVSVNDPVYLNRPVHILEQMYEGGWSAVVDASKFFYQFRTNPRDHPYLGCIHPHTGVMHVWKGLPMGGTNPPACAGRYGLALLRKLRKRFETNEGVYSANCWWSKLKKDRYDPALGHGYVLLRRDGKPAVRFWVHVDDFLIHGPDTESTWDALNLFLDVSLDCGMLCNPSKVHPPSQTPLYTGFIFDTRGIPTLRVPTAKREKALAMVEHLVNSDPEREVSRLALSVVVGTLESLSEATPSRIGHTYLREFHNILHEEDLPPGRERYYTSTRLSKNAREDLTWWSLILRLDVCRPVRMKKAATLVPTFGDGSGTGTGGTFKLPHSGLTMWMGQWSPFFFHNTSNWKELKTLLLTMQELATHHANQVRYTTLFYFTDNSTTYYVCSKGSSTSPGLHALVREIRCLEILLECKLQVVHVPGVVMILQGTDGLSRGVWASRLHPHIDQARLTEAIFQPCPRQVQLMLRWTRALGWDDIVVSEWNDPLRGASLLHRFSIHYPPPELARQTLIFFLEAWVESPRDTGALFIVPRILAAFWHGLSRHVQELELVDPSLLVPRPVLPIPVVVLAVSPHTLSFRPTESRLDDDPRPPRGSRWHRQQATNMRGLQPWALQPSY